MGRVRRSWVPYAVAVAATAAALLLRSSLNPLLADRRPYLTLFGAVAIAVWYGRWRPGVVAASLGFFAANFFFVPPFVAFTFTTQFAVEALGYALSTGLIIGFGEAMHRARERAGEAELSARRKREALRVTFASIGDAVITTDTESRVTFLNAVAESLTGWSLADAVGQPLHAVFHIVNEQTRAPVPNPATRAVQEGVVVGLANHTILVSKDGSERPIDDSAAPIRDAGGTLLGCVLVFRDVTARRRAETELRRAVERARSVIENVVDGIITIDERGSIQTLNPAAERLFGYAETELRGQNVKLLMPEPWHGEHDGYLAAYLRTGKPKIIGIGREVAGRRKDGTTFPMELAVSEFFLGEGRYFTGIVRDISAIKQANAALQEANRRKDVFLATLAHELRNPLAPIRNAIQVLKAKGPPDADLRWCRAVIDRQVHHMSRLLDDLFDVSRITYGKLELRKEPIELAGVLHGAIETSRPHLDQKKLELAVSLPQEPIHLSADPVRLAQVFANLLNNAAKYTPVGGHVRLACERQGSDVVVSVTDDGEGIDPAALPHIFTPFSQERRVRESNEEGLGIGLSLVHGLVELHGGSIEAHSDGRDTGSRFVVRLPLQVGEAPAREPVQSPAPAGPVRPRRLLIADDLEDSADSLALLLQTKGHQVITAYDGEAALAAAEQFRPEIALVDIGMPKRNGYDTCRAIREHTWGEHIFIIALTGWGQPEDRQRAAEAGFDHHMVKPVDLNELTALLATSRRGKARTRPANP